MNNLEFRLLNEFQRNWPLEPQPYGAVGEKLGTGESWVLERLAAFQREGVVSRVGAVFAPGTIGASTLAALEVPAVAAQPGGGYGERFPGSEPQL